MVCVAIVLEIPARLLASLSGPFKFLRGYRRKKNAASAKKAKPIMIPQMTPAGSLWYLCRFNGAEVEAAAAEDEEEPLAVGVVLLDTDIGTM